MKEKFRLGLVANCHLKQLIKIMKFGHGAFKGRPAVQDFFQTLQLTLRQEIRRREENLEEEWHEIEVEFNFTSMHPASIICLEDFFYEKANHFAEIEPPVSGFFYKIATLLTEHIEQYFTDEVLEALAEARRIVPV